MRIGILGGTFDPVHNGHVYLAKEVQERFCLDKIIFIPAYLPPHKKNIPVSSARHRYNMVRLAIKNIKNFQVSQIEIKRKGRSYLVETLTEMRRRYGHAAELFFITGSDSLKDLKTWKNLRGILNLCKFVVVKRPGFGIGKGASCFMLLDIDAKNISSTNIRRRVRGNQSVKKLVPGKVAKYIRRYGLYKPKP